MDQETRCLLDNFKEACHSSSLADPTFRSFLLKLFADNVIPNVSDEVLMSIWITVKEKILSILNERKPTWKSMEETDGVLELINTFIHHCPHLPYDVFWEECIGIIIKSMNTDLKDTACGILAIADFIEGLLCLMDNEATTIILNCMSSYGESAVAKALLLLELLVQKFSTSAAIGRHFFNASFVILGGFQLIIDLLQWSSSLDVVSKVSITDSAWEMLQELRELDENLWRAAFTAVLHKILDAYLKLGPTVLEEAQIKSIFCFLSRPCLGSIFLDSITSFQDFHSDVNKSVISAAFQVFEIAYRRYPFVIISCCAEKLVSDTSDNVATRMECLYHLTRMRKIRGNESSQVNTWSKEVTTNIITSALCDSSVRVRRSALQLLFHIDISEIGEEEFLYTLYMKIRDQDAKIRIQAFEKLSKLPMHKLASFYKESEWKIILHEGLFEKANAPSIRQIAENLLVEYLLYDQVEGCPSSRLKLLGFENATVHIFEAAMKRHITKLMKSELQQMGDGFELLDVDAH